MHNKQKPCVFNTFVMFSNLGFFISGECFQLIPIQDYFCFRIGGICRFNSHFRTILAVAYMSVTHNISLSRLTTERIKRKFEIMWRTYLKPRLVYIDARVSKLQSMNMSPPASCGDVVAWSEGRSTCSRYRGERQRFEDQVAPFFFQRIAAVSRHSYANTIYLMFLMLQYSSLAS